LPERYTISVHFCSISLKDGTQLRNRYKRRAESIQFPYEEVTDDGTLLYLRVNGGFDQIDRLYKELRKRLRVPRNMMNTSHSEKETYLDLPWFLTEDKNFLEILKDFDVTAGVYEILPFRRKDLFEVCEYTPIQ
jgi:pyruvate formate-lyase activating enzyme-like uncharacterized protein